MNRFLSVFLIQLLLVAGLPINSLTIGSEISLETPTIIETVHPVPPKIENPVEHEQLSVQNISGNSNTNKQNVDKSLVSDVPSNTTNGDKSETENNLREANTANTKKNNIFQKLACQDYLNYPEITSMRTEYARFYKNNDGTITAVIEAENQTPTTIDNQIESKTDSLKGDIFQNKSNRFQALFPKKPDHELLNFSLDNTSLSFGLKNSLPSMGKALDNCVKYPNIMSKTDIEYKVGDNGVKENIILKDSSAPNMFSFSIKTDNLTWQETENGELDFYSADKGKKLYSLSPIYSFDANGNQVEGITQSISPNNKGFSLDITIDKDKLTAATYPVTIDPFILQVL